VIHRVRKLNIMNMKSIFTLFFILIFSVCTFPHALSSDKYNRRIKYYPYRINDLTIIGEQKSHMVTSEDTFLDIARKHELGYNEMAILYPETDPWMPPSGENLTIPSFWILPPTKMEQLVINIPELRIYFFKKKTSSVQTYPISIGYDGWQTPEGTFSITEKRVNPTWYIPQSLQEKYGMSVMPPGPENPLGNFVMRFSESSYSIHGTHMPWGVGRLISHGCVRCYPEHIRLLYPQMELGTKVEVIYEPIKFGQKEGRIFVEIHPDVYGKIFDFEQFAAEKLKRYHMTDHVDPDRYEQAVHLKNGMPTDITLPQKNDIKNTHQQKSVSTEIKPLS